MEKEQKRKKIRLDGLVDYSRPPAAKFRYVGDSVRKDSLRACLELTRFVEPCLGPTGKIKVLSEEGRPLEVTRDGFTIVTGVITDHPAAKLMVELAKAQDDETGDGTTSIVILAGELMSLAETLIDSGLHPTLIAKGYKMAAEKAIEFLDDLAVHVDEGKMLDVARTSLKDISGSIPPEIVVEAIKYAGSYDDKKALERIKIETIEGSAGVESSLIKGYILRNWTDPGSPKTIDDAKICIVHERIQVDKPEYITNLSINASLYDVLIEEERLLIDMSEKIRMSGINVLVCKNNIDVRVQSYLHRRGIMTISKIFKYDDLVNLSEATGAKIITDVNEIREEVIGYAKKVEERKIAGEEVIIFKNCKNLHACSFLIRGITKEVHKYYKNVLLDALSSVSSLLKTPKALPGGGATEVELAMRLKRYAKTIPGKEQLAIEKFADALEIIPKVLAKNSGLNPVDVLLRLRAEHAGGNRYHGLEAVNGEIGDMVKAGVVEAYEVKRNVILGASEIAMQVIMIDGILKDRARYVKESIKGYTGDRETYNRANETGED
jgi:chaperonin GroEL (HSP60 family)